MLCRAWSDTRSAVAAWLADRGLGRTSRVTGEAMLAAWMWEDSASVFREDLHYCLADGKAYCAPHMTNLSVALQESVMHNAGDDNDWVVLHWISSIAFLPICGSDVHAGVRCAPGVEVWLRSPTQAASGR